VLDPALFFVKNRSRVPVAAPQPGDRLLDAANEGEVHMIAAMLRDGADVNHTRTVDGSSALYLACVEGTVYVSHPSTIRYSRTNMLLTLRQITVDRMRPTYCACVPVQGSGAPCSRLAQ
jgi:hypothetical protein